MPSPTNGSAAQPHSAAATAAVHQIRTLALVGPAAAGKTQLAEALLLKAGALGAAGSLERGSTVSDHDPLERKMQHSLNTSVMHLSHGGCRVHLLDTPGSPDCLGQSLPALEAVETAAIVINAAVGIEPMAVRMMDYAAARHLDRLIIVNRIDAPGVNLPALLAQIQERFGKECLPVNLPDDSATKVVDCFYKREGHSDFGSVDAAHRALVEQVVEVDAELVERYLNEGDVDASELHAPLEQALREGHLIPVCFTSGRSGAGVAELLDIIVKLLPNPSEANPPDFLNGEGQGAKPMHAKPDPALHVLAHVFKVAIDPFVGRLGLMRVHQGTVTRDSQLYIGDGRKPFKVGHLFMLQGKDHVEVSRAVPGDIVALAKVDDIHFDAVLHDAAEDDHIHLKPLDFPKPVHGLAISPKRHGDEQRMWEILSKLVDEDPCLKLEHAAATNETIIYGLGELHLRVLLERLRETYRFEVNTPTPKAITATKSKAAVLGSLVKSFCALSLCHVARALNLSTKSKAAPFPASTSRRWKRACVKCWPVVRWPATRWWTCGSSCSTASTTAWTAKTSLLPPPAAKLFWLPSMPRGRWCWSPSYTSRSARPNTRWATSPATWPANGARSAVPAMVCRV
jgi:elongation factor G